MITQNPQLAIVPSRPAPCGLSGLAGGCSGNCSKCPGAAQLRGVGFTLPEIPGVSQQTLIIVALVAVAVVVFLVMRNGSGRRDRARKMRLAKLKYTEEAARIGRS